jgi:hypothetical protein
MADLACTYTLSTGSGTIVLNQGTLGGGSTDDLYWVTAIHGLDGPTLRTPIDDVPFGDGGLIHKFWKGPRHPAFEGSLIVQSVPIGSGACQEALNDMEDALNAALGTIIQTAGTLSWTPAGGGAHSISVFYEIPLDIQPQDNFALRSFSFGLVSASANI